MGLLYQSCKCKHNLRSY